MGSKGIDNRTRPEGFDEIEPPPLPGCAEFWGRIGTTGQEKAEEFDSEDEAGKALETLAQAMRRQGCRDL